MLIKAGICFLHILINVSLSFSQIGATHLSFLIECILIHLPFQVFLYRWDVLKRTEEIWFPEH